MNFGNKGSWARNPCSNLTKAGNKSNWFWWEKDTSSRSRFKVNNRVAQGNILVASSKHTENVKTNINFERE